jgi:starch-binding outer membrane protein, SusD/RagB family
MNMKRITKYLWAIALAVPLIAGISGCKKFLDRRPLGVGTEEDISGGGLEGKVFGLYGALRNDGMTGFNMLWFKTIRSDDAAKGSTPGDIADGAAIFDNFDYNKDFWLVNGYWDDHFNFINLTNDVIHEVDSLQLTEPAAITNKAEAMFMRAYAYFDLVRDFGSVPLVDFKIYELADANIPKSSIEEIYAQIDADLTFASQNLPVSWPDRFIGRVTKGSANALAAKTKLYRQDWAGALAKAEEVINSGEYELIRPYHKLFKEDGENSTESIFEVQMYVNGNGSVSLGNNHNQVQGVRGSGEWDLGWGFNVPTQDLVDSYETGDPRKNSTILFSGQSDDPSTGGYGRTVPASPPLAQPFWNKKVYPDPARRAAITAPVNDAQFTRWLNIKLIRYADVLLMAAEAATEIGGTANIQKALGYLEEVRDRARNGAAVLPAITTTDQAQLRDAIRDERRAEFGMEFERFYDLVRWGLAEAELGPLGYDPRNRYYPIPQPAIDKSNNVLEQNPDY